jgi:hypothetical protein
MSMIRRMIRVACVVGPLMVVQGAWATEYHGLVTAVGLPLPGATVTVMQGGKKTVTVTDSQGFYTFPALADGAATLEVEMTGFAGVKQEISVAAGVAMGSTELKLLTLEQMRTALKPVMSAPYTEAVARVEPKKTGEAPKPAADQQQAAAAAVPEDVQNRATDGVLINGSVNNAATSQYTLAARFGNTASGKSLYNFSLNARVGNSALDARSYSLAGVNTTKPATDQFTGGFAVQGPLKIPGLLRNGPNIFIGYQRTRNSVSVATPGLVPTLSQRSGDFSQSGTVLYNPVTGMPYTGNMVPVSAQAAALLQLYPLPNLVGNAVYNYQVPLLTDTHQDALNSNVSKTIGRKDQVSGTLGALSSRTSYQNLVGFTDATQGLGLNSMLNWSHTFNAHLRTNVGYQFSRQSNRLTPYWANRANISGNAGITGNDQDPAYWGPPTLNFTGGLASLTDGQASFIRNGTNGVSLVVRWNHYAHNVTAGLDFRRQEFNYLTQANPRGTFSFTGAATAGPGVAASGTSAGGADVADCLAGVPDTSQLSFGNADKYLRQTVYDGYLNDDWRVNPQMTVNVGVRYEYGGPVKETKGRLVNLDVARGFASIAPVLATMPKGTLTGTSYPSSLMRADRAGLEPRLGVSWRPIPGSSTLVRAGYGVTYDTSVYQGIALNMAQQAPLAKSLTVANSAACPLTLANGFNNCATTTAQTFGVDPNFRVGYVQTWNLSVQRDLPGSLQMVATYLGNKGTRGVQEFLPNTNPAGATVVCASCPSGFEYITSSGNSTRESGQIQLRRRLKSGFTASALYTYSKSIDDDSALGGQGAATLSSATLAQDWLNLRGERGLSTFDQRHLLSVTMQYTTGMGKGGGTLLSGWRGRLYKEWTVQTQITAGSGLPETPLASAVVVAGYSAFVRPNVTNAPLYAAAGNRVLNPAAYAAPAAGQWGNARRDSIAGPEQFAFNAAMVRTFRLPDKLDLDLQVAATNALNHVTYASWITNINSTQFGVPAAANAMRSLQTSLRFRY